MGEVVEFPQREVLVWECVCGCTHFELFCNGEIRCVGCGLISNDLYCYEPE